MKEREKERKRKDRERERENRAVSFDTPTTEVDASYKKLPSKVFSLVVFSNRSDQGENRTKKIEHIHPLSYPLRYAVVVKLE